MTCLQNESPDSGLILGTLCARTKWLNHFEQRRVKDLKAFKANWCCFLPRGDTWPASQPPSWKVFTPSTSEWNYQQWNQRQEDCEKLLRNCSLKWFLNDEHFLKRAITSHPRFRQESWMPARNASVLPTARETDPARTAIKTWYNPTLDLR